MYIIVTEYGDVERKDEITEEDIFECEEGYIDIINANDFTYLTDDGWKEIPYSA